MNTLNPNMPLNNISLLSNTSWPEWGSNESEPPIFTFVDDAPGITLNSDTYRQEPMAFLTNISLQLYAGMYERCSTGSFSFLVLSFPFCRDLLMRDSFCTIVQSRWGLSVIRTTHQKQPKSWAKRLLGRSCSRHLDTLRPSALSFLPHYSVVYERVMRRSWIWLTRYKSSVDTIARFRQIYPWTQS